MTEYEAHRSCAKATSVIAPAVSNYLGQSGLLGLLDRYLVRTSQVPLMRPPVGSFAEREYVAEYSHCGR